jgi:heat shock protein HslJ
MKALFILLILSLSANSCENSNDEQTTKTLYIGDHLIDCVGVGPQKCMLVKENSDDDFTNFYGAIEGFDYEEGYNYILKVGIETIKNPPADGSSLKYSLIKILEKEKTTQEKQMATQWKVISLKGIENLVENPTLLFDEKENKVSGSASCNNFFGSYNKVNNDITFSQLGTTRKMCPDMLTERTFINNLNSVRHFKIEKDSLFLLDGNQDILMECEVAK